ncbi:hypothetical protein LDHU3_14.0800:CDS1 [Leishmania donovani]|uniref:Hypothetical_protein n=1 Tax=Leishmania donovani TaxID=5661 RepID=A0A504XY78_LEIDO|nr:hypothetical protein CGC20_38650 [Leishmania donovani]CAJ1987325.1 hypothetical protein LDHU3_14.0800:CDS1 [Leishmania donovani]VDZ43214.1 hypothetical_protein [Leishmania donovani]
MTSKGSPVRSGASLTADELEEKLATLHNYLSTPYRARAEAILQRRRQREARASLNRSHKVLQGPEGANPGRVPLERVSVPFHSPASIQNPSPAEKKGNSVEKAPGESRMRVAADISTTPTEFKSECDSEDEVSKRDGSSGLSEPSPTACAPAQALPMDPHTRRYVQQLEWQVKMLADALQQERERLAEVDARVVQPLLRLADAALQQQVQLECALASCRARERDERGPLREEVCSERDVNLLCKSLGDILKEGREGSAPS